MTAGGYLTWDDPTGMGVYVDGRLEVYDTPFFSAYMDNLSNFEGWKKDADARGIQSVMVFHRWANRHGLIRMLLSTSEWRLVYHDETAVIFVRAAGRGDLVAAARTAFTASWQQKTEQALGGPRQTFPWQWSIDRYTGQLAYARVLETLGEREGALKWFEAAIATGLAPEYEVDTRQRVAQYLASAGQFAQARLHLQRAAAVDPSNATTRNMLGKLDAISH
jgi:tetratricopeptide (TPR) repeat protein